MTDPFTNIYLPTGELSLTYGSLTYPVGYTYDYAGRMSTMTTWSGFAGGTGTGPRVTTWNYDPYRGFLTNKAYADGLGPVYAYTPGGRMASRTWARTDTNNNPIVTTYGYDLTGSLTNIVYTNGTPCVTNGYDRLGRLCTVVQNGMTDTLTYNLAGGLLGETFSGGPLDGLSLTNGYDAYLRRTNLSVVNVGSGRLMATAYGYDNASRLATVSDGTNNAVYTYVANSPLVGQIVFKHNGATRMTTTKAYDYLNRLTQICSAPSAAYTLPQTFNYNYNPANQRTKDTLADGSYWVYGYDSLGQVTNGCKYFADGTPVAGQQFDYAFDTIGNRTQTQTGGDSSGANLRVANYYANTLNQLTNRYVTPYVDITGASILTNAVTVNGQTAYRKEEYFRQELPVNNTNSALWTNIIVAGGQSVTGNVYVAQEPEKFKYDADGNLTNDGRWAYVWDAENRLVQMMVNTNVGPQYQLNFAYDSKGRRIQKVVATNGVAYSTNNFFYDGWNLVASLNSQASILASFIWGSDLSGSQQDAGGVGGLLWSQFYTNSSLQAASFYAYDGSGNVTALINAADGTLAANYEYGPFGEVISATGPMAKANPIRFSTKYQDDEGDLVYFGYRYYDASTGRWQSKDPIAEKGGKNIYGFISNNAQSACDKNGLAGYEYTIGSPKGAWDVRLADINLQDGIGTREGFKSAYLTIFDNVGCGCSQSDIVVSQAIRYGPWYWLTEKIDVLKKTYDKFHNVKWTPIPDYYIDAPSWLINQRANSLEIVDSPVNYVIGSPSSERDNYTWNIEDCAICRKQRQDGTVVDTVLGCVRFDFIRHFNVPPTLAAR